MQLHRQAAHLPKDRRVQTISLIALLSLLLLSPFALNTFQQNHSLIGLTALIIIVIQAYHAWEMNKGNSRPWLVLFVLSPCMIAFLLLCFQQQGITAALWTYPVVLFYYCALDDKHAWLANAVTLLCVIPQAWSVLEPDFARPFMATLIAVSALSAISARATNTYQKTLEDRIVSDPLTGLLNRTVLNDTLNAAVEQHQRLGTPMSLLLLDLDNFKYVNDTYGHDAGDNVLTAAGRIIKDSTRLSDSCFRIGGEEFLCLLYGSNLDNAKRIAERIRLQLVNKEIIPGYRATTSIGVSSVQIEDSWQSWKSRTDKLLYQAKHDGRNRVTS